MSHSGAHVHKNRDSFGPHIDKNKATKEINATRASWSQWFHQSKAFTSKVDNRSYAQVVASSKGTWVDKSTGFLENHQPPRCNPVVRPQVKKSLANKVVNDTLNNFQESV